MSRNWAACPVKSCWEILQYEINYNIKLSKTIIRIKKLEHKQKETWSQSSTSFSCFSHLFPKT